MLLVPSFVLKDVSSNRSLRAAAMGRECLTNSAPTHLVLFESELIT